jgi:hypothetical protein
MANIKFNLWDKGIFYHLLKKRTKQKQKLHPLIVYITYTKQDIQKQCLAKIFLISSKKNKKSENSFLHVTKQLSLLFSHKKKLKLISWFSPLCHIKQFIHQTRSSTLWSVL